MLRASYPTLFAWREGTIYPGSRPAGVTTRSPRMVTESLLSRSMLIKMYLTLRGMCHISTLYLQSVNFMRLFDLSNCLTQQFYQKASM